MRKDTKCVGTVGRMFGDVLPSQFADSLVNMMVYSQAQCPPDTFIHYTQAEASWHELGRQQLVDSSQGDWLLSLDSDHVFAPDLLQRLLALRAKHKTRVLSAIYQYKIPPHKPVANIWTPEGGIAPLGTWDFDADVIEIGPVGAGCLLIDRDVFVEIKEKLHEQPFGILQGLSEDYSFAKRCKQLNIPMYLAPKVQAHHLSLVRNSYHIGDYLDTLKNA